MEKEIGRIIHYFARVGVAVCEITGSRLERGDIIRISGRRTELYQQVDSLEVDHRAVPSADRGVKVGLKVNARVRPNDRVFKYTDDPEKMSRI
ncbi:MAG: hypothetical protein KJ908_07625 [Acidobacteria bacterium]|nr:hypothetical protein [Acidobacteriota bacterium]MBU4202875.1 hypothetical protein [Acidobacteriota bacterium]